MKPLVIDPATMQVHSRDMSQRYPRADDDALSMQAYVYRRYGGPEVVELAQLPTPVPKVDEVLVKVHATTVTAGDWRARTLAMPPGFGPIARLVLGPKRPRQPILGTEFAGVIEAVGSQVTRWRPGDAVLGFPGGRMGSHAQYRALPQDGPLAPMPAKLSFEQAAALPFGGTTALHFLGRARVKPGERVLVNGASGNVGTALVQLARHQGASVTGVTSGANIDLVRSLGADDIIDYTRTHPVIDGAQYDVIADTVGSISFGRARPALRKGGRFLAISAGLGDTLAPLYAPLISRRRVISGPAPSRSKEVREVARLAEAGALRPVVDRTYEWEQMREAHAYVESRRKRGSVVVRVPP